MKLSIKVASTSQTVNVFVRDSSSTTGGGLTGLVFNTASLTAYYILPRAAAVAIALVTQTATGAWSSGGFVEIDATNAPGWYRLDVPNATVASGRFVDIHLKGAANMAPLPLEIELTGWDNQNATTGGIGNVDVATSTRMATFTLPTNFSSLGISAAGKINEVVLTDTLTTYTGDTPQTGDAFARIGVAGVGLTNLGDTRIANLDATVTSRTKPADTQAAVTLVTTTTALTNAPTSGDFTAAMKTSLNAATPSVTVSDKTGFSLSSLGIQAIWDALTSALSTVGSVGKLLVTNIDTLISSRTKPADTQAAVTTVTNLTNAAVAGDFTATMKTSLNSATPAVTISDKTGFSLTSPYDPAKTAAQAGDAMALTSGERTTLAGVIWGNAARTLTSFGTLVADAATAVWGAATRTLSAFGFTVATDVSSTVTTNLNATVASRLASSAYTAPDNAGITAIEAKTNALPAFPAAVSDIPTANANADALLKRDWTAVSGEAAHSAINALRNMRNRVAISGSTVTVYKEDGTTSAYTLTITTDATQDPIVTVAP